MGRCYIEPGPKNEVKMMTISDGLCFDDVLLRPKYSTVSSRSTVDLSVKIGEFKFSHPFIPANMATITGYEMAYAVCRSGGLALVHRFMSMEEQLGIFKDLKSLFEVLPDPAYHVGFSAGIKGDDKENVDRFVSVGVKILCIDIAHCHSKGGIDMVKWIKDRHPDVLLIAGNVATGEGAVDLWKAGADVVKVNIGAGSLCTTRIMTGCGVPQLSALIEVSEAKQRFEKELGRSLYFISDGGAVVHGDLTKALCFADMVMTGRLFAGCLETPSPIKEVDGVKYKDYVGSSTLKTNHIEGVEAIVEVSQSFDEVLSKMREDLQSGCSYQGAHNLVQLKQDPRFVRISSAGLKESHAHDVQVIK